MDDFGINWNMFYKLKSIVVYVKLISNLLLLRNLDNDYDDNDYDDNDNDDNDN